MHSSPAATGANSILDAATALFADEGYESVSVASIAAQAGVCKANVFHHFASKESLYLAVMKGASAEHADYAEKLYQAPGRSADKVRKLIEFEIRNMLDNTQRTRLMLREASDVGHARVRKLARAGFQRNISAVVNLFKQGCESGEFRRNIDPAAAAMLVGGATQFFFNLREALHEFHETSDLKTPETYAQRIAALVLSGVLAVTEKVSGSAARLPAATRGKRLRRRKEAVV